MINGSAYAGAKIYTVSRKGARFLVLLYDGESGDMLAMIEADRLGQMRTGAASGVATKYMARKSADTLGVYGSGWQAESQMMAICAVRQIKTARVYSRNAEQPRSVRATNVYAAAGVKLCRLIRRKRLRATAR